MKTWRLFLLLAASFPAALPSALSAAQPRPEATLRKILLDNRIWGEDFPAALARLQSWKQIGESNVTVFSERIVGSTPYTRREEALPHTERLLQNMSKPPARFKPEFTSMMERESTGESKPPQASIARLSDDGTFRVIWSAPGARFLRPALTLEQIEKWLGPAEKISRQVIQSKGERRPVILTLHSYAGGAVSFVEWDLDPRPGLVNRVLLDVAATAAELYEEER